VQVSEQLSPSSLPVPFLPPPGSDEILGSWLSRIAITNGLASVPGLLKWLEVPKRLRRIVLADIVRRSDSTLRLVDAFGLTYAECISMFSTRPYWESMHSYRTDDAIGGIGIDSSNELPPLLTFRGRVNISDKDLNQAFFKVCPACLYQDWQDFGCCYFHRSHQLWGSRVCYDHGLQLISVCQACKRPLGDVRSLLQIAPHCPCGADLTAGRDMVAHDSVWWRLAIFEQNCLHSSTRVLAGPGLLPYLREEVNKLFPGPGRASARRALEQTFGEDGTAWIRRTGRKQDGALKKAAANVSLTSATVRVYAALFVACGISFDAACTLVAERNAISCVPVPKLVWKRSSRPKTVEEARQRFTEFFRGQTVTSWKSIRNQRPFVFWLLALEDLNWLKSQLGAYRHGTGDLIIPPVSADRDLLHADADRALGGTTAGRARHNAAVRASYRDGEWLAIAVASARDARDAEVGASLVARLKQAKVDFNNRNLRPKRFTRRDAARGLSVSVKSLLSQAARHAIPDELIEEKIWVFRRRALLWSAMKRLAAGKSLAPTMVLREAGLSASISGAWVVGVLEGVERHS
jgi:hypothetical protein